MHHTEKSSKLYITLKNRLLGMGFFKAVTALELARTVHAGLRKDGQTPEFQHQLEIALHATTLKGVDVILEKLIIVCLLHDVLEDYLQHVVVFAGRVMSIQAHITMTFGQDITNDLILLDKNSAAKGEYFNQISESLLASLAKLMDRCNNFQSMISGKFSLEKQRKYADEVENEFLPMAKKSRKNFPEYTDAYCSLEHMLRCQWQLVMEYIRMAERCVELERALTPTATE